jgi:type IV pilus assembly protein PilE
MKQTNKGFSLIELMIVVAIMGILAAVAYPSYTGYVKRANRADAIDSLLLLAGRMEEYYMNNDTYVGATVNALGTGTVGSSETSDNLYTLAVTVPAAPAGNFSYTLTATPVVPDPECTSLTLNQLGEKGSTPPGSTCW